MTTIPPAGTGGVAPSAEDVCLGMTWWHGLTPVERLSALNEADRVRGWDGRDLTKASVPADAWALLNAEKIRLDGAMPNMITTENAANIAKGLYESEGHGIAAISVGLFDNQWS